MRAKANARAKTETPVHVASTLKQKPIGLSLLTLLCVGIELSKFGANMLFKMLAMQRRSSLVLMELLWKQCRFRYLGRILSHSDNDWPTVHHNLKKVHMCWAQVACV